MGNWTFDQDDDFTLPDGSTKTVSDSLSLDTIHRDFGNRCKFFKKLFCMMVKDLK